MTLIGSSLSQLRLTNSKTIEKSTFVLAIDYSRASSELCVMTPGGIHVLDCYSLDTTAKLQADNDTKVEQFTDVKFVDENSVMCCSSDGYLRLWDTRQPTKVALTMASTTDTEATELKPLVSCDRIIDGTIACAGSETVKDDAFILFWDIRDTRKLMGGYWESHSKDVTQVRFHPTERGLLATAGVDGLVNVFDIDEECEDDALIHTLNAECAVNHLSWLKPSSTGGHRFSLTTTEEELQLWEAESVEPVARNSREQLAKQIGGGESKEVKVDHLIGTVTFDDGASAVVSSSNEGGIELWSESGSHMASLRGAHCDLSRVAVAGCMRSGRGYALWTAGEDGVVCCWTEGAYLHTAPGHTRAATDDLKMESSIKSKARVHNIKPY